MKAYEQGSGAYFATPPVNLIYAFNTSLKTITKSSEVSLEERFRLHKEASQRIKSVVQELGLTQVSDPEKGANGMTAVSWLIFRGFTLIFFYSDLLSPGIHSWGHPSTTLSKRCRRCRRIAQGYQGPLLPHRVRAAFSLPRGPFAHSYISRLSHMGVSVVQKSRGDIDKVIDGLRDSLKEARECKQ